VPLFFITLRLAPVAGRPSRTLEGTDVTRKTVRIAMNGVTGRMGHRQHLVRSILALREQGGLDLGDGTVLWPEPVLVGRREHALRALAERHGLEHFSTDLDAVLADPSVDVYFDAQVTSAREAAITRAIEAGKHIYTEKPTATGLDGALALARLARARGVRHGVVQDKIFLPGLRKLKRLVDGGFFGRILSVRGEFGYWVFEGDWQEAQRPSWNYRAQDGGGIVVDMFPHWEYVLHELFGRVTSVQALTATHIPQRRDEHGKPYDATADDAAYGIFELAGGIVAQINSSWAVRVHRDELVEFQVDGTEGSAVAGLRSCRVQHRSTTPRAVWDPDVPAGQDFRDQWQEVPDNTGFDNGFKAQWELFLRHVHTGTPYRWDLLAGARGVQLAELGLKSAAEGRRVAVPEIEL
jgi:predicted dehydrogenase